MNVLYITHRVPWPPDKGDRIRNWHVLRQLAGMARVSLATLADEPVPVDTTEKLTGICEAVHIAPITRLGKAVRAGLSALGGHSLSEGIFQSSSLRKVIEGWQRRKPFDAVIVSASSLVPYLRNSNLKSVPAFVDVVDVDSQKWFDFAEAVSLSKRWLYRFEGHRLRRVERELPSWAHTITLVSEAESRLFDSIAGKACATTATNGVDLEYFSCRSDRGYARSDVVTGPASDLVAKPPRSDLQKPILAFVGAFDYLPNIDAARWFAREVWPSIHQRHPAAELRLIGRNPSREVQALAGVPGIVVTGSVPDVRPHLAEAAIVVVPMRLSRGLQNKVLEALALGKATIASPPALAAITAQSGRDLLKAETPAEWIAAIDGLLTDPARGRELGRNGRRFVETHHDWETCLKPLVDRLRSVSRVECSA